MPAKPKTPTITRWGQSNPAYSRGPIKGAPGAFTYSPGKSTPGGLPALPAAGAANAAAAPGPTPLPPDASYDATVAGLQRTRDDTLAALSGQRTQTLGNYGYNAQYNPDGSVASVAFDPSNSFSRAALARTRYQQSKTGTQNSMAAHGNLYAGSLLSAQAQNDTNFNQQDDALQKQLGAALAAILGGERTAKSTYETGVGQAGADRITHAGDNPLYSPTLDQGGAPGSSAAAPSVSKLPSYKKKPGSKGLGYGPRR